MVKSLKTIQNPLHQALTHNLPLLTIKTLIKKNKTLFSEKTKDGLTPLMTALKNRCNFQTINYLLSKNPKINEKAKFGKNALIIALENNCDEKIIKLLLKKKIDINVKNYYNKNLLTPLMIAIINNYSKKIIRLFIEKKVMINECDKNGYNSVFFCLKFRRSFDVFEILVSNGAEICKIAKDGKSALFLALKNKCDKRIIQILLKKQNYFFNSKNTLLELALKSRSDVETIKKLLEKKIQQKQKKSQNKIKDYLLITALKNCLNHNIIKTLINHNLNVNTKGSFFHEMTPLIIALKKNYNFQTIALLLKKGAKVGIHENGESALLVALEFGHCFETIRLLVEFGGLREIRDPASFEESSDFDEYGFFDDSRSSENGGFRDFEEIEDFRNCVDLLDFQNFRNFANSDFSGDFGRFEGDLEFEDSGDFPDWEIKSVFSDIRQEEVFGVGEDSCEEGDVVPGVLLAKDNYQFDEDFRNRIEFLNGNENRIFNPDCDNFIINEESLDYPNRNKIILTNQTKNIINNNENYEKNFQNSNPVLKESECQYWDHLYNSSNSSKNSENSDNSDNSENINSELEIQNSENINSENIGSLIEIEISENEEEEEIDEDEQIQNIPLWIALKKYPLKNKVINFLLKKSDNLINDLKILFFNEEKKLVKKFFKAVFLNSVFFDEKSKFNLLHLFFFLNEDFFGFKFLEKKIDKNEECFFGWTPLRYKFWKDKHKILAYSMIFYK